MVDWTTVGIAALGVAGAVGILALFVPGISGFISDMFSFFSRILFWVLDAMPKPLKILFFLILFFSIAGLIVNFTLGTTKMCYTDYEGGPTNDVIAKVGIFEGISLNFYQFLQGEYISVGLEHSEFNTPDPDITVNQDGETIDTDLQSNHAFVRKESVNNVEYDVLYGLAPTTTIRSSLNLLGKDYEEISLLPENQQWDLLPDCDANERYCDRGQQEKAYFVCLNPEKPVIDSAGEFSCMLKDAATWSDCRGNLFATAANPTTGLYSGWNEMVGVIDYRYVQTDTQGDNNARSQVVQTLILPDEPTSKGVIRSVICNIGGSLLGLPMCDPSGGILGSSNYNFNSCATADVANEPALQDLNYYDVEFNYCPTDAKNQCEEYSGRIYNAEPYPLKVSRDCNSDANPNGLDCNDIEGDPGRLFFDNTAEAIKAIKRGFADNEQVRYNSKGIVNFACNEETKQKPFDVKLYFLGIDILNPKYMVFFVLIGALLSFFGYLVRFR